MTSPADEPRSRARTIVIAGGVVVGAAGAAGGAYAGIHAARLLGRAASFALRAATFRLHRRCPDCFSRLDGRARVCRYCGHRMRPAPL